MTKKPQQKDERAEARAVVARKLEEVAQLVLGAIDRDDGPDGPWWTQDAILGLQDAIAVATHERVRQEREASGAYEQVLRVSELAALSMKTLRTNSELTQDQLADLMQRIGFVGWKRITVAEVESFKRRLSLEELIGIAAIFDTSVVALLGALEPQEGIVLNEQRVLGAEQAVQLIAGADHRWFGLTQASTRASNTIRTSSGIDDTYLWRGWRKGIDAMKAPGVIMLPRLPKPMKEGET